MDGTPRRAELRGADQKEREVALELLPRCLRGGELVVCDKGHVGQAFEASVAALGALVVRPRRADEPEGSRPHLGRIRQRIESVFQTFKDILCLERHGARSPEGLRAALACASSPWRRACGSTTNSAVRPAAWSPSWRRRAESII
jgi:Transposase DDE domain